MNLHLKTYYTIDEAVNLFRGLMPNRVDIDESYFFQLGGKGYIRLGLFKDPTQNSSTVRGTLDYEFYKEVIDSDKTLDHIKCLTSCITCIEEESVILILNDNSVRDLFFKGELGINRARFDNLYSLDYSTFCIPDKLLKDLSYFRYSDKLNTTQLYETLFYSFAKDSIYYIFNEDDNQHYIPKFDQGSDWVFGVWFDRFSEVYEDQEMFSERKIKKEECLVFGEDLQLILDGQHRKPVESILKFTYQNAETNKEKTSMHPKRANSINQIIYGLAKMANLDLSQHQSAYNQFEVFCSQKGIKIPQKDTCGNLFKDAYEYFHK